MRVEVEHLPQSQVQLQIEIDPEMLSGAVNKAYQRLAGRYRVPGFRPGKAPRAVLERAIGPETLLSEATDICMNDAYAQAIKDHDLQPLGYPDVESPKTDEVDPEKPLSFTAKVYIRPQAQLGDYRALRIAPQASEVTVEDVDRVLLRAQDQQAPWESIEDRPAEADDVATLRLLATVGDDTLVDQESWEYKLSAEETPNLPIPGLSDLIIGLQAGETKDATIDLGEDYTPAEHAGKQMTIHLEVLRLERKTTQELDDAFAQSFGNYETLDELRVALKQSMETQARNQAMEAYYEDVVGQVVALSTVEAPPPLIDQEVEDMMHRLQENVEHERKISMDSYLRVVGKTIEELREDARPAAEQRVRADLVLEAVAKAEGVEVPQEQVEEQVRLVASSPTLSNKERRRLLTSDDLRKRIERRLRKGFTISRLVELTAPPAEESATPDAAEATPNPTEAEAPVDEPAPAQLETPSDQHNEEEN
ncbi:MAG TPA: trigger factor [Chloroflexota bacterium]|nr:trigger factor [Chloroflexota bacterium]